MMREEAKPAEVDVETTETRTEKSLQQDVSTRGGGAPRPGSSVELRQNSQLAPDVWIERIRELVREGRHADAVENAQLFHKRYPERALPDDLRKLLR